MEDFDFLSNETVDSIDQVPEAHRGYYAEADGKFTLKAEAKPLATAYVNAFKARAAAQADKKTSSDESAGRRQSLKALTDTMSELGITIEEGIEAPEALRTHVTTLAETVKGGKEMQVNIDKINAEAEKRVAAATEAGKGEVDAMRGSLSKHMIGAEGATAFAKLGVLDGGIKLLMPELLKSAKIVKDAASGEYIPVVVDGQGDVRHNGSGGKFSIEERALELKTEFPMAFKSETPAGAGEKPGAQQKPATPTAKPDGGSALSKISAGLAKRA